MFKLFLRCNQIRKTFSKITRFSEGAKTTFPRKIIPPLKLLKPVLAFSLTGFLGGAKELDPKDEMVMTMKRGILCTQRREFNNAEQILHVALGMAQKQNNQDAITYIYDLMANLALERGEPMKAKKLFVNVLERLFQNGVTENDLKVIHISVKLANLHAQMGYLEEAEIGYKWCLEKLESNPPDKDTTLLRGITLDHYAQVLSHRKEHTEAMKCMKEAFEICTGIMGKNNEQTVKLLNDLASICWQAGDLDSAEKYFKESISLADSEMYIGVLKSNLGILLMQKGLVKEAEVMCKEAWHVAKATNDSAVLDQANYCLNELGSKIFAK